MLAGEDKSATPWEISHLYWTENVTASANMRAALLTLKVLCEQCMFTAVFVHPQNGEKTSLLARCWKQRYFHPCGRIWDYAA